MTYSRYDERSIKLNKSKLYSDHFTQRGVRSIRHYSTPKMSFPDATELSELESESVLWKRGDRFWKLAEQFYGNAELWWVLAWFNKKPTEADVAINDIILIPQPLEKILSLLGV